MKTSAATHLVNLGLGLLVCLWLLAGPAAAGEVFRYKLTAPPESATEDSASAVPGSSPQIEQTAITQPAGAVRATEPVGAATSADPPLPGDDPADRFKIEAPASAQPPTSDPNPILSQRAPGEESAENAPSLQAPAETDHGKQTRALAKHYVGVGAGNIRQTPDPQAEVLFIVKKGEAVSVLKTSGSWYFIEAAGGRGGWGHRTLFSETAPGDTQKSAGQGLITAVLTAADAQVSRGTVIFVTGAPYMPGITVIEGENPRIVCDFHDHLPAAQLPMHVDVNDGVVQKIRVGVHDGDAPKTRLVVDLIAGPDYAVEQLFSPQESAYSLSIHPQTVSAAAGFQTGVAAPPADRAENTSFTAAGTKPEDASAPGAQPADRPEEAVVEQATGELAALPPTAPVPSGAFEAAAGGNPLPRHLYVGVNTGNIRKAPQREAEIAYWFERGQKVLAKETRGQWYLIETRSGRQGWGRRSLFADTPAAASAAQQQRAGDAALPVHLAVKVFMGNIRLAPQRDAGVAFVVKQGQEVSVKEAQGHWYRIENDRGQQGWGYRSLFADPEPTRPNRPEPGTWITAVQTAADGNAGPGTVTIALSSPNHPELTLPEDKASPKIICHFSNALPMPELPAQLGVDDGIVDVVQIRQHPAGALETRLVIALSPGHLYKVNQTYSRKDNLLTLLIDRQ